MLPEITVAFLLLNMVGANVENTRAVERHSPARCPHGWHSFNGHCYVVPNMMGDWEAAKIHCWAIHGYLVEITSSSENTFVADLLTLATSPRMSTVETRRNCLYSEYFARNAWIGLTDRESESHFKWSSSRNAAGYTNWMTSQPDNAGSIEHCVELYNGADRRWRSVWNDNVCQCLRAFVCEK
ncbi:perlucin-like protein isoform X2 [Littorina saxatilis]|uniref:C-type lectin domain-containing protein n=1 Tax=Littorina saxatilis TaxID=31220 RepID=A0AAN9ATS3_9CAEN